MEMESSDSAEGAIREQAVAATTRHELTCILFPGIVRDSERALQCLGGTREISQVYSKPTSKRLGLSLSPADPLAKRTFADLVPAPGLLLRVRLRRRRGCVQLLDTTIVGEVNKAYKFESMFDFTMLPMLGRAGSEADADAECVLHQLLPGGRDTLQWINGPAPAYIVPVHFTRSDRPLDYRYSDKKYGVMRPPPQPDDQHHLRLRPDRMSHFVHVSFSLTEELPREAGAAVSRALEARLASAPGANDEFHRLRQALEERPIWSRSSLQFHTKLSSASIKVMLPTLAFYYRTGPWRKLWVRFGYDPRRQPDARRYQTLDFRIRNIAGAGVYTTPPRGPYLHKKVARVRTTERRNPFTEQSSTDDVSESAVVFRPGVVPSQRQIYYQYCDVKLPEVEAALCGGGGGAAGAVCHARRGWLPPGLEDTVRELLTVHTRRAVRDLHRTNTTTHQESSDSDAGGECSGEGEEEGEFILPDMME